MNVGLDVSCLARAERTGVGIYASNLVDAIARRDRENRYHLCYRFSRLKNRKYFHRVAAPNFRVSIIQEPFNFLLQRRLQVFHGLDARLPTYRKVKKVVTIHDVFSLVSRDFSDEAFIRKKVRRYGDLAARADAIIAVSASTRADIVERLGVPEERIRVIPEAADRRFAPIPEEKAREAARRYGADGPYLFFVGNIQARKNLVRMLEAFASLPSALRSDLSFLLAGNVTFGGEKVLETVDRLGLRGKVLLPGFVASEDLPALHAGASVFMFPTLYEGFGIPILEAMACGTPVVASTVSAHPEVAGDAALLVDPADTAAIAEAVARILEDGTLRERMIAKGFERAAGFSWDKTARMTIDLYRDLS